MGKNPSNRKPAPVSRDNDGAGVSPNDINGAPAVASASPSAAHAVVIDKIQQQVAIAAVTPGAVHVSSTPEPDRPAVSAMARDNSKIRQAVPPVSSAANATDQPSSASSVLDDKAKFRRTEKRVEPTSSVASVPVGGTSSSSGIMDEKARYRQDRTVKRTPPPQSEPEEVHPGAVSVTLTGSQEVSRAAQLKYGEISARSDNLAVVRNNPSSVVVDCLETSPDSDESTPFENRPAPPPPTEFSVDESEKMASPFPSAEFSTAGRSVTLDKSRELLIEASLVVEDTEPVVPNKPEVPLVQAQALPDERKRKMKYGAIFCIAVVVVAVVAGVVGSKSGGDGGGGGLRTFAPSQAPSTMPSSAPTAFSVTRFVEDSLPEYTQLALQDARSPQSSAFGWLQLDPDMPTYSDEKRLQLFALATFFFSTGGENNWIQDRGWMTRGDECFWHSGFSFSGTCSPSGMYTSLTLDRNNLFGTLPPELELLSDLEAFFIIGDNSTEDGALFGAIPSELGNLSALRGLGLTRHPSLIGTIPTELGKLSNLLYIYLHSSSLTGSIPSEVGSLSNLQIIELENMFLSGTIPSAIGRLSNLATLLLYANTLTGDIPTELGLLTNLAYIELNDNEFNSTIPTEIGRLNNLVGVSLFANPALRGRIPTELDNLIDLEKLDLSETSISGTVPTEVGLLRSLISLRLHETSLSGPIPSEIGNLGNLKQLLLGGSNVNGTIPSSLGLIPGLNVLYLSRTQLSGSVPVEVCNLQERNELIIVIDCERVTCGDSCVCTCEISFDTVTILDIDESAVNGFDFDFLVVNDTEVFLDFDESATNDFDFSPPAGSPSPSPAGVGGGTFDVP